MAEVDDSASAVMTFRNWFAIESETEIRSHFEATLPTCWTFIGAYRDSGELKWQILLGNGFAVQLAVHPVNERDAEFRFQSKVRLVNPRMLELERDAEFSCCLPGLTAELNPFGIMVSMYAEGVMRALDGGAIQLQSWSIQRGVGDGTQWLRSIEKTMALLGDLSSTLEGLPGRCLELDELSGRITPTPITLYRNPFVLAAEIAFLSGHRPIAAEFLSRGRNQGWKEGDRIMTRQSIELAECLAGKLTAMLALH